MSKTDFDRFAEDYDRLLDGSVRLSGYDADFFADRKAREIARTISGRFETAAGVSLLNFGCGIGTGEPHLVRHLPGSSICSIDPSPKSVALARERNRGLPSVRFEVYDGQRIPFSGPFDIILLAGVLHHIPLAEQPDTLNLLRRHLSDQGLLFIFEHNPWNPVTRKTVRDCPFDEDAKLIRAKPLRRLLQATGFQHCNVRYIHFFPAFLRTLLPLEPWLSWVPLGAQYYCVASR